MDDSLAKIIQASVNAAEEDAAKGDAARANKDLNFIESVKRKLPPEKAGAGPVLWGVFNAATLKGEKYEEQGCHALAGAQFALAERARPKINP